MLSIVGKKHITIWLSTIFTRFMDSNNLRQLSWIFIKRIKDRSFFQDQPSLAPANTQPTGLATTGHPGTSFATPSAAWWTWTCSAFPWLAQTSVAFLAQTTLKSIKMSYVEDGTNLPPFTPLLRTITTKQGRHPMRPIILRKLLMMKWSSLPSNKEWSISDTCIPSSLRQVSLEERSSGHFSLNSHHSILRTIMILLSWLEMHWKWVLN